MHASDETSVFDKQAKPSAKLDHKTDVLTVFLTGNVLGELKPCGCSGGQLGGLDRRSAVLNSVPKQRRLIVDTGSFVKSDGEQDLIKFNIIVQALGMLDYDLVDLSEKDIEIGNSLGLLEDISSVFNIISPYRPVDVNVPAKFIKRLPLKDKTVAVTVGAFDVNSGPIEQIRELFSELSDSGPAEPEFNGYRINILILNHCDSDIIDSIAATVPLVDCLVCPGESDEPMIIGDLNKRPLVFSVGRFGRYVCKLQIEPAKAEDKLKLSFQAIPVTEDLEQQDSLVRLYKDYQQLVKQSNLLERYPRFTLPDKLAYAGSESCQFCHQYEYVVWKDTVHANAYATLEQVGSQFDPECVLCHVIGMEYESGFISEDKTGYLKDVGCENCHGPCSEHNRTPYTAKTTKPKSACLDCHTPDHSGEYAGNELEYQEKIIHWVEPNDVGNVK